MLVLSILNVYLFPVLFPAIAFDTPLFQPVFCPTLSIWIHEKRIFMLWLIRHGTAPA